MRAVFALLAVLALSASVCEAGKGFYSGKGYRGYRPFRRGHHGKSFFGFAPKRAVVVVKRAQPEEPTPVQPVPSLPEEIVVPEPEVELPGPVIAVEPSPEAVVIESPAEPKVTAPPLPPVDGEAEPKVTAPLVDGEAEPKVTAPLVDGTLAVETDTATTGDAAAVATGAATIETSTTEITSTTGDCSSVVQTAVEAELNTLTAAVTAAGLAATLGPDFVGTVFAPTEEAFAGLLAALGLTAEELLADTELLTTVLSLHVVPDAVAFAGDLVDGQEIPTLLEGAVLTVAIKDDKIYIVAPSGVEAEVVSADIEACDAVVHVIDMVLTPAA